MNIRLLIIWLLLAVACAAQADSVTVYEVDGSTQSNRLVSYGRVFKAAEIVSGNCPRPAIDGTPVANGSWQFDLKNSWTSDSSVRFGIVSFVASFTASQSHTITFSSVASSSACDGTGGLTQAQMTGFNSGNWDAQIVVTATGSTTVTTSAKTMLGGADPASHTWGDCSNNYWLRGPVVTEVVIQDCTSAFTYDFGWTWDGTTMASPVTGAVATASLHPWFDCAFYSTGSSVRCDSSIMNGGSGRQQDQAVTLIFQGGTGPTVGWTSASSGAGLGQCTTAIGSGVLSPYICFGFGQKFHKIFWSNSDGTYTNDGPGQIRIDHNFAYLKSTGVFPNFDSAQSFSTSVNDSGNGATSHAQFVSGDKGEIGGYGGTYGMLKSYASNDEWFMLSREDLLYLYNMSSCGTANSECAKAWQMLTGQSGAIDTSISTYKVAGGAGMWANFGNVPFHIMETRTTGNNFYCGNMADKDALTSVSTCTSGSGASTGKPLSRHAFQTVRYGAGLTNQVSGTSLAGTVKSSGWSMGDNALSHWQDFAFVPYLLTGSPWYLLNEQESASFLIGELNSDPLRSDGSAKHFGFCNHGGNIPRQMAGCLQTVSRAALISPDNSAEQSYYRAMYKSSIEIQEGIMGITGTALTPSDTTCSSATCTFNPSAANRWNWGRAITSGCLSSGTCSPIAMTLNQAFEGWCETTGHSQYIDYSKTDSYVQPWMASMVAIALGEARDFGFTESTGIHDAMNKNIVEATLDSTYNPVLYGSNMIGVHQVGSACLGQGRSPNAYQTSWANLLLTNTSAIQAQATFDDYSTSVYYSGNANFKSFSCQSHGYPQMLRAAATFWATYPVSTTNANCSGGTCTSANAWTWINAHVPYFGNTVTGSTKCNDSTHPPVANMDVGIKRALAQRPTINNFNCTISAPSNGATVSGSSVAVTISCTAGQGSITNIQATIDGVSTGMPSNSSSPLNSTFDSTGKSNGTHVIGCTATDSGGGIANSCLNSSNATVSITINNAAATANTSTKNANIKGATVR